MILARSFPLVANLSKVCYREGLFWPDLNAPLKVRRRRFGQFGDARRDTRLGFCLSR